MDRTFEVAVVCLVLICFLKEGENLDISIDRFGEMVLLGLTIRTCDHSFFETFSDSLDSQAKEEIWISMAPQR